MDGETRYVASLVLGQLQIFRESSTPQALIIGPQIDGIDAIQRLTRFDLA